MLFQFNVGYPYKGETATHKEIIMTIMYISYILHGLFSAGLLKPKILDYTVQELGKYR